MGEEGEDANDNNGKNDNGVEEEDGDDYNDGSANAGVGGGGSHRRLHKSQSRPPPFF